MNPYEAALLEVAGQRRDIVVMTAENRAAIRVLPERLPERFVDTGICEQTLVGMAAGIALGGRIPVVHALAAFLTMRAFEFIRTDVGYARLPVKLVGYVPGLLSDCNGPTHQALEDVALMRCIPGMGVFCPADEAELAEELPSLLDAPGPCYIRYSHLAPSVVHGRAAPGRAQVLRTGRDVTLLVCGFLLGEAERACHLLGELGLDAGLVHVRYVEPLDAATLLDACSGCRRIVTIEDHFARGGLHEAVAELYRERRVSLPLHSISLGRRWFPAGRLADVLVHEGLSADRIAERVHAFLN